MATESLGNMIYRLGFDDGGFSAGMDNVAEKMALVRSEMKASASQFGELGDASDKLRQKQEGLSKLYQLQGSKIEQLRAKYEELAREKGENSQAALQLAQRINNETAMYNRLGRQLRATTLEINTQNSAWTRAGRSLQEYGERLQTQGERLQTIGKVGFAGITAPIGLLGGLALKSAADFQKAQGKISSSLNMTKEEAREVANISKDVWVSGFGESLEEANQGVIDVRKNLQGLKGEELEQATKRAYVLEDTFKFEIPESTRAAKALIDNFAVDAGKAFDYITVSAQKGGDYSNELLDTISEYSAQFKSAGLSIDGMFNIMIQGAQNGAWNMDKVGDAVKEFNIRAQDGSKTTATGFKAIGLDADKMGAAIAKGGKEGEQAFMATVSALAAMKDPMEKDQAGVALFGTQWEDLRGKVVTALNPTKDMLGDVKGATDKAGKALKDNFGDRVAKDFRLLQTNLLPVGEILLDKIEPALQAAGKTVKDFTNWFQGLSPAMQNTIVIAGLVAAAFPPVVIALGAVVSSIGTLTGALGRGAAAFGRYRAEAALTQRSTTQLAAANTAAAVQMNASGAALSRNTRGLRGMRGASSAASVALSLFGGKWGGVLSIATMFAPEIIKGTKSLFNFRGGARTATAAAETLGGGAAQATGKFAGFGAKALGLVRSLGSVSRIAGIARLGFSALGGPIGLTITGISLLAEGGYHLYNHMKQEQIPTLDSFGKKVSESTTKAVLGYKKLNDQATVQLNKLQWSGETVSKKTADSIVQNFDQMGNKIKTSIETKGNQSYQTLSKFLSSSKSLSQREQNAILNNVKKKQNQETQAVDKGQKQIKEILNKASAEKRQLTQKERTQINSIQKKMMNTAVQTMSKGEVEQKAIMSKLKNESKNITARQAADTIKNSIKARDGSVKEANKKYDQTVAAIVRERDETGSISKKQADKLIKEAKRQRDGSVKKAEEMHKNVVKEAEKQAGGHIDQVDKETGDVLTKWDSFVIDLAGFINSVTGGINKVLEFMHIPTIPEWTPKGYNSKNGKKLNGKYAKGTNFHPGGAALVGEEGWELAHSPGIGTYVVGMGGPQIWDLPRGTSVLPHDESKKLTSMTQMPGYAGGVGDFFKKAVDGSKKMVNGALSFGKSVADKVGDVSATAMDLLTHGPGKLIKKLFNGLIPYKSGKGIDSFGTGIFKILKNGAAEFLKGVMPDQETFKGTGGTKAVNQWVTEAVGIAGVPISWIPGLVTIAMKESGGNPNAINLWDSNAKAGHPSQGLMQTIPSTFNAYKFPGHNNILNPIDNILAAIRYIKARYGDISNHPGLKSMDRGGGYVGYAAGGVSPGAGGTKLAALNERGYDEHIITTDPKYRERSIGIWARAGQELGIPAQTVPQMPSIEPITQRQDQQIALLIEQNALLREIAAKEGNVIMNGKKVGKVLTAISTKEFNDRSSLIGGIS
ncbi:phage tail tape measure protein [Bacillus glycinifermentans]|uniref:phage tail tape measure protein n=1 Tax=Bacillus glycinifermentans TaxID=1664069 RepID=UPI002DB6C1C2|nr:phage tail tape measure protein [Bacillus glycinifermentans]MEC0496433.1 phage tail tape measure protein [Bacillus glycinifermentans]MEC0541994.1 phage tail tape measure protein [Bacillus glycinifermentans]